MKYIAARAVLGVVVCAFAFASTEINSTCGMKKTCLHFPDGCDLTDGTKPCRFVSWTKSETVPDSVTIELRSALLSDEGRYIAVALGTVDEMRDADMYFCLKDRMGSGAIEGKYAIPADLPLDNDVTLLSTSIVDKYLHCKFNRAFSVKKPISDGTEYDYDISSSKFHVLVAEGEMKGNFVDRHDWRDFTAESVNLTKHFPLEEIFKIPLDATPAVELANTTAPASKHNDTDVVVTSEPETNATMPAAGSDTKKVASTVTEKPKDTTTSGSTSAFVNCWFLLLMCLSLSRL